MKSYVLRVKKLVFDKRFLVKGRYKWVMYDLSSYKLKSKWQKINILITTVDISPDWGIQSLSIYRMLYSLLECKFKVFLSHRSLSLKYISQVLFCSLFGGVLFTIEK